MMRIFKLIFNFALFYGGWILCIMGAARGYGIWPPLLTWFFIVVHFCFLKWESSPLFYNDLLITFIACMAGIFIESGFLLTGVLEYKSPNEIAPWLAPFWIVTIYCLLGICMNHSLGWLKDRILLSTVLGGISGAMCYAAGVRMGAATFLLPRNWSLIMIGIVWALFFPALMEASAFVCRRNPPPNL